MKCIVLAAAEVQCTVSRGHSCLFTVICIWLLATLDRRHHVCVLYGDGQTGHIPGWQDKNILPGDVFPVNHASVQMFD